MKLIEYLPNFMQDIKEFKELFSAEDIEMEQLKVAIEKIFSEIIVKTAEGYGLDRYEKIYQINAESDLLEARRLKILLKINDKVPYSYKWLVNTLDTVLGKENYKVAIDYANYNMKIEILLNYSELAEILKKDLIKHIPANIKMDIDLFAQTTCYIGANIRQVSYEKIDTCIETINEKEKVSMNEIIGANIREQSYINIKSNSEVYKEKEIIDTNTSIGTVISRQDYINIEEVEK